MAQHVHISAMRFAVIASGRFQIQKKNAMLRHIEFEFRGVHEILDLLPNYQEIVNWVLGLVLKAKFGWRHRAAKEIAVVS
jgi:hypothetical protein